MLYTDSGSPIPNDKPMEQFKASDQDWKGILRAAETSCNFQSRTILELRDRVEKLEAAPDRVLARNQTGEYLRAGTPVYLAAPAKAVPSDEELWEVQLKARLQTRPDLPWHEWGFLHDSAHFAAHRSLYDHGYRRCLEEAKATWELNSGLASDLTALQEENAQLKSKVEELVGEMQVLDRGLNNAARDLEYKERHLNGAYCRIKELERELKRRDAESESEPAPELAIPEPFSCGGCRWYSDSNSETGLCCRYAPTHKGFPRVAVEGWCGDFTESTHKGNH